MSANKEIRLEDLDGLADWDPVDGLTSKEAVPAYLTDILASGDMDLFNSALADVARAIGTGKVAEYAGLTREGLEKALHPVNKPRFETITSVLSVLGLSIRVVPLDDGIALFDEGASSTHVESDAKS